MDKDKELTINQINLSIEDLTDNLPAISRGVGDILGEAKTIKWRVQLLIEKYELSIELYKNQVKELTEKIKELEGGQDNEQ